MQIPTEEPKATAFWAIVFIKHIVHEEEDAAIKLILSESDYEHTKQRYVLTFESFVIANSIVNTYNESTLKALAFNMECLYTSVKEARLSKLSNEVVDAVRTNMDKYIENIRNVISDSTSSNKLERDTDE
jgi:hypothetical protein